MADIFQIDYAPTEAEIKIMLSSGNWQSLFGRDYASLKQNVGSNIKATNGNTTTISGLNVRLTEAEGKLTIVIERVDQIETEFDAHVASNSAHGVVGDNVGSGNYCTTTKGGVVLLGGSVSNASSSSASIPSAVAAAPAAYDQAYAQSQTDAINGLITAASSILSATNGAVSTINALLSTLRTAKHIQP